MKESQKGSTGDHRHISDPIEERKEFIKRIKENATKEENSKSSSETDKK